MISGIKNFQPKIVHRKSGFRLFVSLLCYFLSIYQISSLAHPSEDINPSPEKTDGLTISTQPIDFAFQANFNALELLSQEASYTKNLYELAWDKFSTLASSAYFVEYAQAALMSALEQRYKLLLAINRAIQGWEEFVKTAPPPVYRAKAYLWLGKLYLWQGEPVRARDFWEMIIEMEEHPAEIKALKKEAKKLVSSLSDKFIDR